jgi:hypothetical protein
VRLEPLGRVVGQFGQGLGSGDTHANGNARTPVNLAADCAAQCIEVARDADEVDERFVDAIDLRSRHHGLDQRHHALAHLTVQCII